MFTRSKLFLFKVYFEFVTLNDSQPSFILRLFRRPLSPPVCPGAPLDLLHLPCGVEDGRHFSIVLVICC